MTPEQFAIEIVEALRTGRPTGISAEALERGTTLTDWYVPLLPQGCKDLYVEVSDSLREREALGIAAARKLPGSQRARDAALREVRAETRRAINVAMRPYFDAAEAAWRTAAANGAQPGDSRPAQGAPLSTRNWTSSGHYGSDYWRGVEERS